MTFPSYPDTEAQYLAGLTNDDMVNGGHRTHFIASLLAFLALTEFTKLSADEMVDLAEQITDDAASAAAGSGTETTVSNIRAAADVAHYLSMRRVVAANAPVSLTDASSISWDMATGINFTVTLGATGRTLANPSSQTVGKSGFIDVVQDSTGGRTITTWGNNFKWFGPKPSWPTAAGAISKLAYFVKANGEIHISFAGNSE